MNTEINVEAGEHTKWSKSCAGREQTKGLVFFIFAQSFTENKVCINWGIEN